jgi:hypothetical protein
MRSSSLQALPQQQQQQQQQAVQQSAAAAAGTPQLTGISRPQQVTQGPAAVGLLSPPPPPLLLLLLLVPRRQCLLLHQVLHQVAVLLRLRRPCSS